MLPLNFALRISKLICILCKADCAQSEEELFDNTQPISIQMSINFMEYMEALCNCIR